jgi:hypothetical protein
MLCSFRVTAALTVEDLGVCTADGSISVTHSRVASSGLGSKTRDEAKENDWGFYRSTFARTFGSSSSHYQPVPENVFDLRPKASVTGLAQFTSKLSGVSSVQSKGSFIIFRSSDVTLTC